MSKTPDDTITRDHAPGDDTGAATIITYSEDACPPAYRLVVEEDAIHLEREVDGVRILGLPPAARGAAEIEGLVTVLADLLGKLRRHLRAEGLLEPAEESPAGVCYRYAVTCSRCGIAQMVSIPLEIWDDVLEDATDVLPHPQIVNPPTPELSALVVEAFQWDTLDGALLCPACAEGVEGTARDLLRKHLQAMDDTDDLVF